MYECPECGSTHATAGGLVSHLTNKQGDAHAEYDSRKAAYRVVFEQDGDDVVAEEPDDSPETNPEGSPGDANPAELADANPPEPTATDGGEGIVDADARHDGPQEAASDDADAPACPKCEPGNVARAPEVAAEHTDQLDDEHLAILRTSDYVCTVCGGVWDDD